MSAATPLYNSLMAVMAERHSCRSYDAERPVAHDTMALVLEAARVAPSACNRQPWKFAVLHGDDARALMSKVYNREWAMTAPACIVAIGLHAEAWHRACDGKDHTDVDVSIAVEHICLAAAALGLGTCWVCNFDPQAVQQALDLPHGDEVVALIPIGYPSAGHTVPERKRKSIESIVERV